MTPGALSICNPGAWLAGCMIGFKEDVLIFSFAMLTRVPHQSALKPYAPVPDDALHEI